MDHINNNQDNQNLFIWDANNLEEGFSQLQRRYKEDPRILNVAMMAFMEIETESNINFTVRGQFSFLCKMAVYFVDKKIENFSHFDFKGPQLTYEWLMSRPEKDDENIEMIIKDYKEILSCHLDLIDACMEVNPQIVSYIKINTWVFNEEKILFRLEKDPMLFMKCCQYMKEGPLKKTQKEMLPLALVNKFVLKKPKALPKFLLQMIFANLFFMNHKNSI